METAKINGVELEYEISGTGEPVVFIHGAFIADTFRPLLAEPSLAGRYRLILYRRRGYAGSSPATGVVSVDRQAEDCRALLLHLKMERAHIVGHSFGGAVALQLAMKTPDVAHSLALLEPALMIGESGKGYWESLSKGIERSREADAAVVVDEFMRLRWPEYRITLDRTLPGAFEQAVNDAGTVFESELPGLLDWRFGEADARSIARPALSVVGGESEVLWPRFGETHRLLLKWMPNAEGFVLPGTTHFLQVQDSRGMAEALAGFWSRHPIDDLRTNA